MTREEFAAKIGVPVETLSILYDDGRHAGGGRSAGAAQEEKAPAKNSV